ncbi:MAG: hypothetical protein JWQ30_1489 [Sediminibacterium sp.]|nr:hypothetical protein [Sediminibacterium sp.]
MQTIDYNYHIVIFTGRSYGASYPPLILTTNWAPLWGLVKQSSEHLSFGDQQRHPKKSG